MTYLCVMTRQELRAARDRLGMTQASLAAALGISISQLGNYERGWDRQNDRPSTIPRAIEFAVRYLLLCGANDQPGGNQ